MHSKEQEELVASLIRQHDERLRLRGSSSSDYLGEAFTLPRSGTGKREAPPTPPMIHAIRFRLPEEPSIGGSSGSIGGSTSGSIGGTTSGSLGGTTSGSIGGSTSKLYKPKLLSSFRGRRRREPSSDTEADHRVNTNRPIKEKKKIFRWPRSRSVDRFNVDKKLLAQAESDVGSKRRTWFFSETSV